MSLKHLRFSHPGEPGRTQHTAGGWGREGGRGWEQQEGRRCWQQPCRRQRAEGRKFPFALWTHHPRRQAGWNSHGVHLRGLLLHAHPGAVRRAHLLCHMAGEWSPPAHLRPRLQLQKQTHWCGRRWEREGVHSIIPHRQTSTMHPRTVNNTGGNMTAYTHTHTLVL